MRPSIIFFNVFNFIGIINFVHANDTRQKPIQEIIEQWVDHHKAFCSTIKSIHFDGAEIIDLLEKDHVLATVYDESNKKNASVLSALEFIKSNILRVHSFEIFYRLEKDTFLEDSYRDITHIFKDSENEVHHRCGYCVPKDSFTWTLDYPLLNIGKTIVDMPLPFQADTEDSVAVALTTKRIFASLPKRTKILEHFRLKTGHETIINYEYKIKEIPKRFDLAIKLKGYFAVLYVKDKKEKIRLYPITAAFHKNNRPGYSVTDNTLFINNSGNFDGRFVTDKKTICTYKKLESDELSRTPFSSRGTNTIADWQSVRPLDQGCSTPSVIMEPYNLRKL